MSAATDASSIPTSTDFDQHFVASASRRVAQGDYRGLDNAELAAAAIVNGRLDLLDEDFRSALVRMGRGSAHAVVHQILLHSELEMALSLDDPNCPIGDQCISTRSDD